MPTENDKPLYVQLRRNRWFWEPPLRFRKSHGAKVRALGADQVQAWSLARQLNQDLFETPAGAHATGTVGWVFDKFFESEKFAGGKTRKGLAAKTQQDYRWLAKRLGRVSMDDRPFSTFLAAAIRARHADLVIADIEEQSGHATAHYCARFARRVWKWAGRQEYVGRAENPWAGMDLEGLREREEIWAPDQVAAFIKKSEEFGLPSIGRAALIAYSYAHRGTDILPLTWTQWDSATRRTSKTGVRLPTLSSAYPDLHAAIEAERARQKAANIASTHVLICELTQRPWNSYTFAHKVREIMDAAGLPKTLQFRDLRATALTELTDAGADILDLSTHSGHKDVKSARRYSRRTQTQFTRAAAKRQAAKESS